jgi:hypothetical protein
MFFRDHRLQFFKPLTSKYREQTADCLRVLYRRQYSAEADYGQAPKREQILALFEEALIAHQGRVLDEGHDTDTDEPRYKTPREQAAGLLKNLIESGWIERQVDPTTYQSTYPLSRFGRLFTQALIEAETGPVRTRHRNTRNTLNALNAFSARGDVYDLLDALEASERIIADFTDIIAELEERKRELVREVESHLGLLQATQHFFDYMEKRFQPDVSVRLSADSVEKYRDAISQLLATIRRKPKAFKREAEERLRHCVPDLCPPEKSYLWHLLDTIELRMKNAADVMLPALRAALHGFTKRADLVIRQLSYLSSQQNDQFVSLCQQLAGLDEAAYNQRMARAAQAIGVLRLGLVDPRQVRLQERRRRQPVDSSVPMEQDLDWDARQEMVVQQQLDQAFVINRQQIENAVLAWLGDKPSLRTSELPIANARDLLAMAFCTEVASLRPGEGEVAFDVTPLGPVHKTEGYYSLMDDFSIVRRERRQET